MADPFKTFRQVTVTGAAVNFDLFTKDGRICVDFKGQAVQRLWLDPGTARAFAKALLEKSDRIEADRSVVVM